MVTLKGSVSTEGETLEISVLSYRCSICPPLVTRPATWPSRLLYRRGRKSQRDLWITLYISLIKKKGKDFLYAPLKVELQIHSFLNSILDEGEQSASCCGSFTLSKKPPITPWIGAWVCPEFGLEVLGKTKSLALPVNNPGFAVNGVVAVPTWKLIIG